MILAGDTDIATMGLITLTKPNKKIIIVTEATKEEWSGYNVVLIAKRINETLMDSEYTVIEYDNFVNDSGKKEWLPKCPICSSKHIKTDSKNLLDFIDDTGEFIVLDDFESKNIELILNFLNDLKIKGWIVTLKDEYEDKFANDIILHCIQNRYIIRVSSHPLDFKDFMLTEIGKQKLAMHNTRYSQ
jgi:hypothetical protein